MTNSLFPVKRDLNVIELAYILYKYGKFIAPEQFQRPEAWSSADKKKFFCSILMNRVEGSFVLVDIKSALNKILKNKPEDRANEYFTQLIDNLYEYIVLDGNNRLSFIMSLFNDEYGIPEGEYEYIKDVNDTAISKFVVKRGKNNKFSDLPNDVQKVIKERKCIVSEYTQICYDGLSEVFTNVNSGVPLNAQELRNAMNTPWAEYVRTIRYEIASLLDKMFDNYKKRLIGDNWIVETLDLVYQSIDIDQETNEVTYSSVAKSSMDKLYKSVFMTEEDEQYYLEVFSDLSEYIDKMLDENILPEKTLKRKSTVQNLFYMMCNGIETYEEAKQAVVLHEKAYQDKDRFFNYNDEEYTFKSCCDGLRKQNVEFRHIILTEIVEKVTCNSVV